MSFLVLLEAFSIIFAATESAARDGLADLQREFKLPEQVWDEAAHNLHSLVPDCFWLEDVESGSSKFNGWLKAVVVAAIVAFPGRFAFDIVKDTEPYRVVHDAAVRQIDEIWHRSVAYVNQPAQPYSSEKPRVEAVIVGDRIRFLVVPPREKRFTGRA